MGGVIAIKMSVALEMFSTILEPFAFREVSFIRWLHFKWRLRNMYIYSEGIKFVEQFTCLNSKRTRILESQIGIGGSLTYVS